MILKAIRPESTILSIVGDIDSQIASQRIQSSLGNWNPDKPVNIRPVINYCHRMDSPFNANIFTISGPQVKDKSFPAWFMGTQILGSGKGSELYRLVRNQLGISYLFTVAYSFSETESFAHFCVPTIRTKKDDLETIRVEFADLVRKSPENVTIEKLDRAKSHFTTYRFAGDMADDNRLAPFSYNLNGLFEIGFDTACGLHFQRNMTQFIPEINEVSISQVSVALEKSISSLKTHVYSGDKQ